MIAILEAKKEILVKSSSYFEHAILKAPVELKGLMSNFFESLIVLVKSSSNAASQ